MYESQCFWNTKATTNNEDRLANTTLLKLESFYMPKCFFWVALQLYLKSRTLMFFLDCKELNIYILTLLSVAINNFE